MCSKVPSAQRGAPAHGEATSALSVTHLPEACVHFKRGVIGEGADQLPESGERLPSLPLQSHLKLAPWEPPAWPILAGDQLAHRAILHWPPSLAVLTSSCLLPGWALHWVPKVSWYVMGGLLLTAVGCCQACGKGVIGPLFPATPRWAAIPGTVFLDADPD